MSVEPKYKNITNCEYCKNNDNCRFKEQKKDFIKFVSEDAKYDYIFQDGTFRLELICNRYENTTIV